MIVRSFQRGSVDSFSWIKCWRCEVHLSKNGVPGVIVLEWNAWDGGSRSVGFWIVWERNAW